MVGCHFAVRLSRPLALTNNAHLVAPVSKANVSHPAGAPRRGTTRTSTSTFPPATIRKGTAIAADESRAETTRREAGIEDEARSEAGPAGTSASRFA